MYDEGSVVEGVANTPSQKLVIEWILGTYEVISEETGQNAWRK
jgi:hypothetical protein